MIMDNASFIAGLRLGLRLGRRKIMNLITKLIRFNGTYRASDEGVEGYSAVTVNVPNSYTAADEGKVVQNGALEEQGNLSVTQNGVYDTTTKKAVTVSVAGGESFGFELYGATFDGSTQTFLGALNNNYVACCFHDNMQSTYKLNGVTKNFTQIISRTYYSASFLGSTVSVSDNTQQEPNAILNKGSKIETSHSDNGSYLSIVGAWVGYPAGGRIYENMVSGTVNSIILDSAHSRLLVFVVGSSQSLGSANTIEINGVTYSVTNTGTKYDRVYSVYAAIVIDSNADTNIAVTFPASCYNYVSVIGLD